MSERITGTVEHVVYSNSDTSFSVIELGSDGELITVVGELAGTAVGEELAVYGEYTTHPTFGVQFKASAVERTLPSGAAAILKYLSNGAIAGIGPSLARRMVDAFGEETLDVLAKYPEKLENIRGFSKSKARQTSERFARIYGLREALNELSLLSLDAAECIRLYKDFGPQSAEVISDNPYMLCGYPLYKEFEFADGLAGRLGIDPAHVNRLRAGIIYILRHNMFNGHTCLPAGRILDKAAEFLSAQRDSLEIALWDAVDDGLLRSDIIDGGEYIFLPPLIRGEMYIAERLSILRGLQYRSLQDIAQVIEVFEKRENIVYERQQKQAITLSLSSGVLVITGGPGTGKTTALNAIISLCEQQGDDVAIVAPTGRAAKRVSELTNRDAKTIHRLLEVDFRSDEDIRFLRNEENPLRCDVVVIDEMSMVDVLLFESLLRGIRPQCRLIMVGDSNQLPAVGAGNLLGDIIDSECCPVVEFEKIFRQAETSGIVVGAHRIVAGEQPDLTAKDSDFFFIPGDDSAGPGLIADLVARRLPKRYNMDPFSDIQVLSPQRRGVMGTEFLNDRLREKLNPPDAGKVEIRIMGRLFRSGDKVMQTRNNYDIEYQKDGEGAGIGVFNGDIGVITDIVRDSGLILVEFDDGKKVGYSFEQAKDLLPAFAVTVHKSQGSEFSAVIVALSKTPQRLRYRNLLYTAVTRARDILILVGDENIVAGMVANDRKALRFTALKTFIQRQIL